MKRFIRFCKKLAWITTGTILFAIVAATLAWTMFPRQVGVSQPFTPIDLDIHSLDYYDLGAVDWNRDGYLDIFTTNHSSRQSLLTGNVDGTFTDELTRLGLDQVPSLPGLEDTGQAPNLSRPGLYIYFVKSTLHFTHVAASDDGTVAGTVSLPIQFTIESDDGFHVTVDNSKSSVAKVSFETGKSGDLALRVTKSTPIYVNVRDSVSLQRIFVGADQVNPPSHSFTLFLKDRHGIAWSDQNDDGVLDAFITRGALSGRIAEFRGDLNDQYFVSTADGRFLDISTELGFEKQDCPARQVAWVDANNDGLLDLYIACGRQVGGFWEYVPSYFRTNREVAPNLLFIQTEGGHFQESAARFGLDFGVGGTFLWFDVDSDGDADLLWASELEVALYRNTNGHFLHEIILPESTTIQVRKLAAADFDSDGDLDVFAAASLGSKLLLNESGALTAVEPDSYGLPSSARTAAWVDYDNDGRMELYTWPDGIYRQEQSGQFQQTGLLRMPSPYWPLIDPRVLWFDYDNDGDRDVIIAQRFFPQAIQKTFSQAMPFTTVFLRNDISTDNNWFEMELRGRKGNREAIGASVTIVTDTGRHTAEVGQSESAHYSQGHYRLYFGLGKQDEPDAIEIRWPGNVVKKLNLPVNTRIVQVEQDPDLSNDPAL